MFIHFLQNEQMMYSFTGFSRSEFQQLFQEVGDSVSEPITGKRKRRWIHVTPEGRLLLVLIWIRKYLSFGDIAALFSLDESTVRKTINTVAVRMLDVLQIQLWWPSDERLEALKGTISEYPEAIGSMDMSIHQVPAYYADEDHFYRKDKGTHFMNHLAVCDFRGVFLQFTPGFIGRSNELVNWKNSSACAEVKKHGGMELLGDSIFAPEKNIRTPKSETNSRVQKANRAVIENCFGRLQNFKITKHMWRSKRTLEPFVIKLTACLYNWQRRHRQEIGLELQKKM